MPLYFLHVRDSDGLIRDLEGSRLSSLEAARIEAVQSARQLMVDSIVTEGRVGIARSIEVCDANGARLLIVPFCKAVTV
jgi:Domain of unknown function (DUF6894)